MFSSGFTIEVLETKWPVNFTLTFGNGTLEIFDNNTFRIGPACTRIEAFPVKLKRGVSYSWRVIKNYPLLLVEFAKESESYNCRCHDHYKYNNECQEDEEEEDEDKTLCFWFNFYDSRDRRCHEAWLGSSDSTFLRANLQHHNINDSKYNLNHFATIWLFLHDDSFHLRDSMKQFIA